MIDVFTYIEMKNVDFVFHLYINFSNNEICLSSAILCWKMFIA